MTGFYGGVEFYLKKNIKCGNLLKKLYPFFYLHYIERGNLDLIILCQGIQFDSWTYLTYWFYDFVVFLFTKT